MNRTASVSTERSTSLRLPPPPPQLEAMIFDLGGTLIDYLGGAPSWPEMEFPGIHGLHAHLCSAGLAVDVDTFRHTFIQAMDQRWRAATESLLTPPTLAMLIEEVCSGLDMELAVDVVEEAVASYCRPIAERAAVREGAAELLAWLSSHGVRIGLISNSLWPGDAHRQDLRRFGLLDYFDATMFSSENGLWKPDPRVFHTTLERLGASASGAAFIGDRLAEDVVGAQRAGLRAVFLEGTVDYEDLDPRQFHPDARIRRLTDLPAALAQLWR